MPGYRPNAISAKTNAALARPPIPKHTFPPAALIALSPQELDRDIDYAVEVPPAAQDPLFAIYPQDENLVPFFFAADTPFDCQDGDGIPSWAAYAD